ncbi:MAG: PilZ domain-containing protein [bacterium]
MKLNFKKKVRSYKREYERQILKAISNFSIKESNYMGISENISPSGIFITTPHSPKIGQEIKIHFQLPQKWINADIKGTIIHRNKQGIGIKFSANQAEIINTINTSP